VGVLVRRGEGCCMLKGPGQDVMAFKDTRMNVLGDGRKWLALQWLDNTASIMHMLSRVFKELHCFQLFWSITSFKPVFIITNVQSSMMIPVSEAVWLHDSMPGRRGPAMPYSHRDHPRHACSSVGHTPIFGNKA
jgi:hypothetical protein